MTDAHMRRLAARLARLEKQVHARTPQLTSSSIDDGYLIEHDDTGALVGIIGKQYDGTHLAASVGGPVPPQTTTPYAFEVSGGLVVGWDGLWADDVDGNLVVAPMDFLRVDVAVSTDIGFDGIATPPTISIVAPRGGEVFIPLPEVEHYVALVPRSISGAAGPPSYNGPFTPQAAAGGTDGLSAYQIAVNNGFTGTEAEWLASLQGEDAPPPPAPTESPTPDPVGVPGSILVRLPAPADPGVGGVVDIFVSETSPVDITVGSADYHGTGAAGAVYTVDSLPDGSSLEYFEPLPDPLPVDFVPIPKRYFIVALARNSEGAAAASPEIEGSMRPVTGPDVAVNAVWAGFVAADRLLSGVAEAQIVLAGMIESQNALGPEFGRVGLSAAEGFYARGVVPAGGTLDDAPVLVHFPVDGSPNIVSGVLSAEQLTVTGGATFRAATSFESEAVVTLEQGVVPPNAPPSYVVTWNVTNITGRVFPDENTYGLTKGHNNNWFTVRRPLEAGGWSYVEQYSVFTGAYVSATRLPDKGGKKLDYVGVVYDPVRLVYHLLGYCADAAQKGWWLVSTDSTFAEAGAIFHAVNGTSFGFVGGYIPTNVDPVLGWDHAANEVLVAYSDKTTSPAFRTRVDRYTVGLSGEEFYAATWLGPSTAMVGDYSLGYVGRGTFDYGDGVGRTIVRYRGSGGGLQSDWYVFTTSSNADRPSDHWPWALSHSVYGGWWNGTNFYSIDATNRLHRYQGGRNMWVSGSGRWSFDYRWLDNKLTRAITVNTTNASKLLVATNYTWGTGDIGVAISGTGIPAGTVIESVTSGSGNAVLSNNATATGSAVAATLTSIRHETPPSPRASFSMIKRALVTLTMAAVPTGRGGVNDPDTIRVWWGKGDTDATTTMARERTLPVNVTSMSFDGATAAEGGSADAAFGNATPAVVRSAALDSNGLRAIDLRGDGTAFIEMLCPLGVAFPSMVPITVNSPYKGWYRLNGQEVLGTDIPIIAAKLGTGATSKWGAAATGMVKLPDLRGRVLVGAGTFAPLGATDTVVDEPLRTLQHDHDNGTLAAPTVNWGGRNNAPTGGTQTVVGNIEGSVSGNLVMDITGRTSMSGVSSIPYAGVDWIVRLA